MAFRALGDEAGAAESLRRAEPHVNRADVQPEIRTAGFRNPLQYSAFEGRGNSV